MYEMILTWDLVQHILTISEMHRCLQIAEILNLIFECVLHDFPHWQDPPEDYRTITVLARTCRMFQEPALNILWLHFDQLDRLVKCMPEDLWTIVRGRFNREPRFTLNRDPIPSDFDRVYFYSKRIRSFRYSRLDAPLEFLLERDLQVLDVLGMHPSPASLFSGIRSLSWDGCSELLLRHLHMFLQSTLSSLTLSLGSHPIYEEGVTSLLLSIPGSCPNIQEFEFHGQGTLENVTTALAEAVRNLLFLTKFTADRWTHSLLESVAALPRLKDLRIECWVDTPMEPMQSIFKPATSLLTPFPSIKRIELDTAYLPAITGLLRSRRMWKLERISVEYNCPHDIDQIHEFLHEVENRCSRSSLQHLYFASYDADNTLHTLEVITIIPPLLAFRNLRSVHFTVQAMYEFEASQLEDVASAWPNLEELFIMPARYIVPKKAQLKFPPIHTLVALVVHCPRLKRLEIPIDARSFDQYPLKRPVGGCTNERITSIHFGVSLLTNPAPVAAILSDLFPNLKSVDALDGEERSVVQGAWADVDDMLCEHIDHRDRGLDCTAAECGLAQARFWL
ncbi:hypothetical protein JAAARDRAFT_401811 [Jaapia argillacea MUCL 33604]|uniref:F-box domain-containing protein n=1 Tax=Jaapia argillacea MUCL 33604 TaxID=933084 RepID=A0A067PLI0_9AGAM|nr:hypothetical protein JAAARDRAFT_401811 [Jaapia argillacea MUCL 33604]